MKRTVEKQHPNGKTARRYTCEPRTWKLEGEYRSWYDNGRPELVAVFADGKPCGEWTEWHKSGAMKKHCYFSDGKPCGRYEEWWENGRSKQLSTYREDGTAEFTHWNEDGTLNYRGETGRDGKFNIQVSNFLTYEQIPRRDD